MKNIKLFFGVALFATVLFSACKPNNEPPKEVEISLDTDVITLMIGETHELTATVVFPADATDKTIAWTTDNSGIAIVENGIVTALAPGTANIYAKAGGKTAVCEVNVPPAVKINGVVWAMYNVDAFGTFAPTPESAGCFYQWNRPKAWAATGDVTGWDGTTPTGTTWEAANDPCPNGWRVPTSGELESLVDAGSFWATDGVTSGRVFGTAPNQIFLPAVGWRVDSAGSSYAGSEGCYWSSTKSYSNEAYSLCFSSSSNAYVEGDTFRFCGFSVRCVAE